MASCDDAASGSAVTPFDCIPFDSKTHAHLTPYLAALQASCITYDGAMLGFVPPLSHEKLLAWWKERIAEVGEGRRRIWILARRGAHNGDAVALLRGVDVLGVVMLVLAACETGAARAHVETLLVHQSFRRRRGAAALMAALEAEAAAMGRTLLLLHAEADSPGQRACKRLGYIEVGTIPKYGMGPGGELRDSVLLYKQL